MKYILIIILSLLLTSPLSVQSKDAGVLYGWKTFHELQWMSFGNGKLQPKYIGEINNGKPDGLGILYYPSTDGEKVVGSWKEGKQWNTEHHNKDGEVIGKYVNGEIKLGVLFHRYKEHHNKVKGEIKLGVLYFRMVKKTNLNWNGMSMVMTRSMLNIQGKLKMVNQMVKESSLILKQISTKENGKTGNFMVKEPFTIFIQQTKMKKL